MNPDTTQPAVAPGSLEEALLEIRHGIDAVDDEIVALLNKRAALSLEVGRRKDGRASAIFKPFREQEVLARLTAQNPGPLPAGHLLAIYREILSSSRRLQRPPITASGPVSSWLSKFLEVTYGIHNL